MERAFFRFLKFQEYPEIIHGISDRNYGDMKFGSRPKEEIIKNRQLFFNDLGINISQVVFTNQPHGSNIVIVSKNEQGKGSLDADSEIVGADGLITSEKNIFLAVKVADCLPILIYDPTSRKVGIIHGGWRGIVNQIIPQMLEKLRSLSVDIENLIVGIGPGICQKHFIVRRGVLEDFKELYPKATFVINNDGYVDLKKAAVQDFLRFGVPKENIEITKFCTVCDNGLYGSFRKEGNGVPEFLAIIGMRNV